MMPDGSAASSGPGGGLQADGMLVRMKEPMSLRLAAMQDLPRIKDVYGRIVDHMDETGIRIWDDVYPCEFFEDDIANERLYVVTAGEDVAAAFALCDSHPGEGFVQWRDGRGKALYVDRLGVDVGYRGLGVGGLALGHAKTLARKRGAEYLRLFVVDANEPAIRLYGRSGFVRRPGV